MLLDEEGIPKVVQEVFGLWRDGEQHIRLFDDRRVTVWGYVITRLIPKGLSEQLYNDWFNMELEKYCLMKYFPNKGEADD